MRASYLVYKLNVKSLDGDLVRVGFIQMESKILEKEMNVDRALHFLEKIDADLVVLPELFNTGYDFSNKAEVEKVAEDVPKGFTTQKLLEVSREKDMTIVAGIAERKCTSLYNTAVIVSRKYVGKYRKVHLFLNEKKFFKGGDDFKVFGNLGVMICFDWVFPESARVLMLKGADIIAHPANLVLPHCPRVMQTRSLENRVFSVTANRVGEERALTFIGQSQIVNTRGELLYRAGEVEEEFLVKEICIREAKDKNLTELNNILEDRYPQAYEKLAKP